MRYLGLDFGSKTLGIAISDKTNTIASIYKTIFFDEVNYDDLIHELELIINENDITTIVLGYPLNMNNTIGDRAQISIEFKDIIESRLLIPVVLMDERLTSVISNNVLIDANVSRRKRKKKVDGVAAVVILQSYLDKERYNE